MDKKSLLKQFGKNVKIERIKQDMTQEELAEKMNVSQNYVAGIECGRANMSLAKVLELSDFLNVDINVLLRFQNSSK